MQGELTKWGAKLVLDGGAIGQAVGSPHEGIETTIKIDQGAWNGAACLTGEQSMSL